MATPQRVEYPHVTTDPAVSQGQPCISETGIRVTELASAHDNGNSPADLREHFKHRPGNEKEPLRPLTMAEVFAGLAYYHDNIEALEALRAEDERLADAATKQRHAAILKHYLGE
jgi:uncharacterized protein (DUF433 family)